MIKAILLASLTTLCGCSMVGVLAYKAFGPTENPAEFAPAKDKPMVVLVENYRDPSGMQQQSDQLAAMLTDRLIRSKVKIAPIVPAEKLLALRTEKGEAFDKMKIPEIGLAVGAKQVVYVNLQKCSAEGMIGGNDVRYNVDAFVKVVDAETGKTLWPDVGDGREFKHQTDYNPSENSRTEDTIRETMLDDLSIEISLVFIPHQPESEVPQD